MYIFMQKSLKMCIVSNYSTCEVMKNEKGLSLGK